MVDMEDVYAQDINDEMYKLSIEIEEIELNY